MTPTDLFQPARAEPFDITVNTADASRLLRAMESAGVPPRLMDCMPGQYRLRGHAPVALLARLMRETGGNTRPASQSAPARQQEAGLRRQAHRGPTANEAVRRLTFRLEQ
jgi:hypothetical protein